MTLDDVVLLDEAHLDVELRELGLAVGARVLVAEAAGDLVVALVAAHHQQLLEELRRLRQRVPAAGLAAVGDEEVARALGRRAREDRRLDLQEVLGREHLAHRADDRVAQDQRVAHPLAAQVEHPVAQAQHLVDRRVLVDRERRRLGLGERRRPPRPASSISPGRDVRVDVLRLAPNDLARSADSDVLGAQRARRPRTPRPASGWKTSWTIPERSRRSTKISPPWSRRRWTQPATRACVPARRRVEVAAQVSR